MPVPTKDPLYFITLIPPENIRKEVELIKKEIKNNYGIKHALKLPAHITIQIPFRMHQSKEKKLFKKLREFSAHRHSWNTKLDGFGRFAKNVIFIKIQEHQPFVQIHKDLQEMMLGFLDLKSHEISAKIHPHITIAARDLKRSHFPGIWEDFKDKSYSASFSVQDIYLFKHNGENWDLLKVFSFAE